MERGLGALVLGLRLFVVFSPMSLGWSLAGGCGGKRLLGTYQVIRPFGGGYR